MESQLELAINQSVDAHYSNWVYEALDELPCNFTITDPCISGNPIVFASRGFLEMFGYSRDEVVGRNGRMFQGEGTSRMTVMEIREAIREERAIQVSLLNYHKNGTPFWILFCMSPVISGEDGRVIHFVAVQLPISRKPLRSSRHGKSDFCLCEDGVKSREFLLGSCRREVCSDSVSELSHSTAFDSFFDSDIGVEVEEFCEASEFDKQKATTSISNILSVLTQYSALRGKPISERSCCVEGQSIPNSALLTSLGRIKQSFVLIDPLLPSMPIIYASEAFLKLTGYDRHEVLGRKHRFISGSDTDPSTLLQIYECIQNSKPCTTRILDYRKDMTSFWNLLHLSPVRNASGKVAYFVEVHMEDCINQDGQALNAELRQLGAIAAVKVAVRSATMGLGSSR
ncbi:protein TWIN LOV 1 [Chenopodium quinoa]|uniref:PAS domain-containing protein n=1 Tax=Chenopodium quinoa TaxID=63459 RepID=A0A803MAY9_CHEQI|nr:protein TWIN LOV 1 [Chenopodium quinoa]XP_021731109.1 protein TWIN LOV 1 [Chenopodium quinoa]